MSTPNTPPAVTTHAFKMQLKPGHVAEYKARHDTLWPDLGAALAAAGIHDYSIFLDEDTLSLFAVLKRHRSPEWDAAFEALPSQPVMRRWWDHMAPLMETEPDNQPRQWALPSMFHFA